MEVTRIDFNSPTAAETFSASLHHTGFAVLYNHPIEKTNVEQLYQQWLDFFLQDETKKEKYIVDPNSQVGWVPAKIAEVAKGFSVKDLKEFFNYYSSGSCPPTLQGNTQKLYDELRTLGTTLLHWLQQYTPRNIRVKFSETLPQMVENSQGNLFRINYYPPLQGTEEEGAVRAAEHTDIDLLTVLTAGTTPGLQALEKNGAWHDIPCEHGNLVINAGDMLQECSNGYYPSTIHRVLNPTGTAAQRPRMSCPMFIHPRKEVSLSERHTADSYLHERLVEVGLRKE